MRRGPEQWGRSAAQGATAQAPDIRQPAGWVLDQRKRQRTQVCVTPVHLPAGQLHACSWQLHSACGCAGTSYRSIGAKFRT
jgi:hypothetical protein